MRDTNEGRHRFMNVIQPVNNIHINQINHWISNHINIYIYTSADSSYKGLGGNDPQANSIPGFPTQHQIEL